MLKLILIFTVLSLIGIVYLLYKGIKDAKLTPEELLFDLNWKVDYAVLDHLSEKYIKNKIAEYRERDDINQKMLDSIEAQFKYRFEIDNDEHDLDNVFDI